MSTRSMTILIAQANDDPIVEEFTPELIGEALIAFGTAMLAASPDLSVVPDRFAHGTLLLTVRERLV